MPRNENLKAEASRARVLTIATLNTADQLGLPDASLAKVLNVSEDRIIRMHRGECLLDPSLREWGVAVSFVRMNAALHSLIGDLDLMKKWLCSPNNGLGGIPNDLIFSEEGLRRVVLYLESH